MVGGWQSKQAPTGCCRQARRRLACRRQAGRGLFFGSWESLWQLQHTSCKRQTPCICWQPSPRSQPSSMQQR